MDKSVVVFGSFVVDLMARTPHLPVPGETVKGSLFRMGPGGKGFNQAVAAHKAGAQVTTVTKLGHDMFAQVALSAMKELGMDDGLVLTTDEAETGCALITVDEGSSQNEIVVVSGACGTFTPADVEKAREAIRRSSFLLTQLEINLDALLLAVAAAREAGVRVILNPAPVQPVPDALLAGLYLITPNEVEAATLTGIPVDSIAGAEAAADWFLKKGVENVVITMGERGAFVVGDGHRELLPVPRVEALDTTGAGDAYNGGLVAALAEGCSLWEAAGFANAVAALAVQRMGTAPAMPTRDEIDGFLAGHSLRG